MKQKRITILAMIAVCAALLLSACGGASKEAAPAETETTTAAETETTTAEETTTKEPELDSIGKKSDDAVSFKLTNNTGKDIKSVSVDTKNPDSEGKNLLSKDDVFEKEETCIVYIAPAKEDAEAEDAAEADENAALISTEYIVKLVLDDDTEVALHAFPLEDIVEGEVLLAKDNQKVAYIKYTNLKGDKDISTLKAEISLAGDEEEPAEETPAEEVTAALEEAPAAPAEEPVYEEPVAEEPVYEEPVAEEPVYEEPVAEEPVYEEPVYEEPVYEEPGTEAPVVEEVPAEQGGQDDDNCVDDGLVY